MKKKNNIFTMIGTVLFIALSATKCDKPPLVERFYHIAVLNNSSDTIYSDLGWGGKLNQYPDTTLPNSKPALVEIPALQNFSFYTPNRKTYEKAIQELAADTLSIYIFSKTVYEDTAWSDVRSGYQVLQRYDLSLDNLKRMDFKVPYPPTAEMAGMKMYP